MLFDTHAHLDDSQFDDQRAAVVSRAQAAGVVGIVAVGTTLVSSRRCCDLAAEYPGYVYAAVGIQPNYVAQAEAGDWKQIEQMAAMPGVRAIGETGLDCYWNDSPLDLQTEYFHRHIALARKSGLPFIVHMRNSAQQILDVLRPLAARQSLAGVMHSFTGDWSQARQFLDLGLHISFAGMLTFKKSADLREVAKQVPDDRLLVETDSPYLSPEPHRGRRPNEPARVAHTLQCLAELRGVTPQRLGEITTHNARSLLALPEPDGATSQPRV